MDDKKQIAFRMSSSMVTKVEEIQKLYSFNTFSQAVLYLISVGLISIKDK